MLKIIIISILILFVVFGLLLIQIIRGGKAEFRSGCCSMETGQIGDKKATCGCVSGIQEKN